MTELIGRDAGVVLFAVVTAYGLIGTLRLVRTTAGPRPWALFAVFELIEAVQVYALLAGPAGRPEADIRAGAVIAVATLCFCAYLQGLVFATARSGRRGFPRGAFYAALLVFVGIVVAAHYAGPALP